MQMTIEGLEEVEVKPMTRVDFLSVKQVRESSARYQLKTNFVHSPSGAAEMIRTILPDLEEEAQEVFGILSLDTKNKISGCHMLFRGSLNSCIVHPREVFKAALLNNAASIVCFHNHPSGDTTPSPEDLSLTERLVEAGKMLGIEVLDHIIIGNDYYSLKEHGKI